MHGNSPKLGSDRGEGYSCILENPQISEGDLCEGTFFQLSMEVIDEALPKQTRLAPVVLECIFLYVWVSERAVILYR